MAADKILEKLLARMGNSDVTLFELVDLLRAGNLCGKVTQADCEETLLLLRQHLESRRLSEESIVSESLLTLAGDFADILEYQMRPKIPPMTPGEELLCRIVAVMKENPDTEPAQFASELCSGKFLGEVPRTLLEEVVIEIRAIARAAALGQPSSIPESELPAVCKVADAIAHYMKECPMKENVDDEDEDDFETSYELFQSIAKENNIKHSTWSMYEVTDFSVVPFPNANKLIYSLYPARGQVEINLQPNSTWLDLWKAADKAIDESGDLDHSFIEDFEEDGDELILVTGS